MVLIHHNYGERPAVGLPTRGSAKMITVFVVKNNSGKIGVSASESLFLGIFFILSYSPFRNT